MPCFDTLEAEIHVDDYNDKVSIINEWRAIFALDTTPGDCIHDIVLHMRLLIVDG